MPRKKKTDDFPMWSIIDSSMDEQANIIAKTRKSIREIEKKIIELEDNIEIFNNRINMYIRNILNYQDYDNLNDLILIKDDYEAHIYPIELFNLDKKIEELPKSKFSAILTKNQATKILNFVREYNHIAYDYEDLVDTFEELIEYDDDLMDDAINSLKETTLLHLCNDELKDETVEIFDDKKHLLVVVQEKDNLNWCFKYIRKEDEEKFNKSVVHQTD